MNFDARLLSGIGVMAAVVESGSFARAGEIVGLTPSGVSRAIARLEAKVGARLFDRHSRKVALTEAGRRFHVEVTPLLAAITEAAETAADKTARVRGRLKLSVDPWFARIVLAPRLPALLALHPELSIEMRITNSFEEMFTGGIDLALRFGPPADSSLISRKGIVRATAPSRPSPPCDPDFGQQASRTWEIIEGRTQQAGSRTSDFRPNKLSTRDLVQLP